MLNYSGSRLSRFSDCAILDVAVCGAGLACSMGRCWRMMDLLRTQCDRGANVSQKFLVWLKCLHLKGVINNGEIFPHKHLINITPLYYIYID